jgi:excisionase family DNA binding protein
MELPLMKVPDVVARLGVSRAKVYELMASGELRSVRVGGSRRIHSEDLDRFIAELDAAWPRGAYARRSPPPRGTSVTS